MRAAPAGGLHRMARIAMAAGAVASLGLMLYAGRHNKHLFITALFTVWVLSPFAGLALADYLSARWPLPVRHALHVVAILTALVSVILYTADAIRPRQAQAAFVYVAVPPATWLAGGLILGTAALLSRGLVRKGAGPP